MDGGTVWAMYVFDSSTVTISRGLVWYGLDVYGSAAITISGGTVSGPLYADESSTIMIAGIDFAVDGSPVSHGLVTPQTGTLTGTLASRDPIDTDFYQGGGSYTGRIVLLTTHLPALSSWGKLALGASLLGAGSLGVAVMRRRAG